MRIVSFAAAFLICLSLLSCNKTSTDDHKIASDMTRGFVCTADITFGELTAKAEINRQAPGLCTIVLSEPENLKGMTFEFEGDKVAVSYKGLELEFDSESLPAKGMAQLLVKALDAATHTQGMSFKLEDNALIVTGKSSSGEFTLKLDKKNGNLLSLSLPSLKLNAVFNNFNFINP